MFELGKGQEGPFSQCYVPQAFLFNQVMVHEKRTQVWEVGLCQMLAAFGLDSVVVKVEDH